MIRPWFPGSALKRASCQSPADSKTKPPSHRSGADDGERAGRGALQHAGLDREAGQPQDRGLKQVDGAERVGVRVARGPAEQVPVAGVLALAMIAPGDVAGQAQTPDDRGGQEQVAAGRLAVPGRGEQADHAGQGDAETPRGVDHAVLVDSSGDREGDGHHDQERGRGVIRVRPNGPARYAAHRACLTARIWSTPIRPSSKASAPPARYRRQTRTCSAVRSSQRRAGSPRSCPARPGWCGRSARAWPGRR